MKTTPEVVFRLTAVAALIVAAAAVFACAPEPKTPGFLKVDIVSPTLAVATGLTPAELKSISESDLPKLFQIHVKGAEIPVAGKYAITKERVEFAPAFPFASNQTYILDFFPSTIPGRGVDRVTSTISWEAVTKPASPTRVVGVDPTTATWPANLLRVYVHFSNPMGRESGIGKIVLREADGTEVTDAFLPLEADFWSPDHRRYTVFFDPGRVKRGILPNRQRGRALVDGRRYVLEISREWRDAEGKPLTEAFRHEFRAGPAIEKAMRVEDWKLSTVKAGTRDPLTVTFPWPIDRGLADRALEVQKPGGVQVFGRGVVVAGDLTWSFTPDTPWTTGDHELSALPFIEDPSGNQVGRAFEVDMKKAAPPIEARRTIPFKVS